MRAPVIAIAIVIRFFALHPAEAGGTETAQALSSEALRACQEGRIAEDRATRLAYFERAEVLAERALELQEDHANAHFALFCSLGEQLRLDGESFSALFGLSRALGELDRTLELDPGHLDALSAKGTILIELPTLLGGDEGRGEAMLWEVIHKDSSAINARLVLARLHCERGDHDEALRLAGTALKIAHAEQRADLIGEAKATVAELQGDELNILVAGN